MNTHALTRTAIAVSPTPKNLAGLSDAAREAMDVRPAEIIRKWLLALSPTASRTYRLALTRFARWALTDQEAPPESALRLLVEAGCGPAHEMVTKWRDGLLDTGLAPGSVAVMTTSICSLLKVCRRAGLITWRLESVAPRVERRQDRRGPRRGEVEQLLAKIDRHAKAGDRRAVRDSAMVRLMYCAAMRRSEVVGLRFPADVDLEHAEGAVVRPRRKNRRERQPLLVSERAAAAIRRWIKVRGQVEGPLFHRLDGVGAAGAMPNLSGESVRRILDGWAKKGGIETRFRPHGLRHAAATHVARVGSLDELMSLGGWKSFSAAQVYLDQRIEQRRRALKLVDA